MKVSNKPTIFRPITITIETREEARAFWHLLNRGLDDGYEKYQSAGGYITSRDLVTSFQQNLWYVYDPVVEGIEK